MKIDDSFLKMSLTERKDRQTDKEKAEVQTEDGIKLLYQGQIDIKTKTDRRTAKQKGESQNVISMHSDIKKEQINKII